MVLCDKCKNKLRNESQELIKDIKKTVSILNEQLSIAAIMGIKVDIDNIDITTTEDKSEHRLLSFHYQL